MSGSSNLDENMSGSSNLDENMSGSSNLDENMSGSSNLDENMSGSSNLDENMSGSSNLDENNVGIFEPNLCCEKIIIKSGRFKKQSAFQTICKLIYFISYYKNKHLFIKCDL